MENTTVRTVSVRVPTHLCTYKLLLRDVKNKVKDGIRCRGMNDKKKMR